MDMISTLRLFGARSDDIVLLKDDDKPAILPYLDMVGGRAKQSLLMPEAVVEIQRQPLLYVYSQAQFTQIPEDKDRLAGIKRLMAMRGDTALIGILRPGILELHSTSLTAPPTALLYSIEEDNAQAAGLIPRLAQGISSVPCAEKFIETQLFRLLEQSAQDLHKTGLAVAEIVSLTGRALFLRFLLDRDILPREQTAPFLLKNQQTPDKAFDTPQNAAATCRWLDQTFNGDLLPLPCQSFSDYFAHIDQNGQGQSVFKVLQAILHFDDPLGAGAYQSRLDWGNVHLAHVPVGLLSQVYERHMEMFYPGLRKKTSAYYTPRLLAELLVDEAFYGLERPAQAKVLDPAAGAGVFLVAAFHKLVAAHWQQTGKRPDRTALKAILNDQIRGFDINCHALKLAALSLYLTRLELDPDPHPIEALRFESLQGKVLFDWSGQAKTANEPLRHSIAGSLSDLVGEEHEGAYDLVIGNPPWSVHDKGHSELKKRYTDLSRQVAAARGIPEAAAYVNPDGVPDLPFLWRSMQWAKPNGRIALILHARWLFKQSPMGIQSRNAILHALHITGILNGSVLRKTEVWPNVTAPFCLLFAENRLPDAHSGFFYVSPQMDIALNKAGKLRIDAQAAEPVLNQEVIDKPWLLKTLFRGNRLSMGVVDKIARQGLPTLGQYWQEKGLALGEGYQSTQSGVMPADFLLGRLDITARYKTHPFKAIPEALDTFEQENVHCRKSPEIYQQPLVLVREGFRCDRDRGRALLVNNIGDVAYSRSYIGLSCCGHPQAELLAAYIFLLCHSQLHLFIIVSTSSQFRVERDTLLPEDIKNLPLVPVEQLNPEQQEQVQQLANQMLSQPTAPPWSEIDHLLEEIYGLNRRDQQVIADTLETCLPNGTAETNRASSPAQRERFKTTLLEAMLPFFSVTGRILRVNVRDGTRYPWLFVDISAAEHTPQALGALPSAIIAKADDLMVSRIIHTWEQHPGHLSVGILDQSRYWTPSQAWLLASDLLRNYGHQLEQGI